MAKVCAGVRERAEVGVEGGGGISSDRESNVEERCSSEGRNTVAILCLVYYLGGAEHVLLMPEMPSCQNLLGDDLANSGQQLSGFKIQKVTQEVTDGL